MGAGIPGTGMATLFYIVSALLMPCRELIITAQGRSSRRRWSLVTRQFLVALAICAIGFGTYRLLSESVVVPNVQSVPIPAVLITVLMFFGYLLLANAVAFVIPRRVTLPPPKVLGRSGEFRMGPALERRQSDRPGPSVWARPERRDAALTGDEFRSRPVPLGTEGAKDRAR